MDPLITQFTQEHCTLNTLTLRRQQDLAHSLARFDAWLADRTLISATDEDLRAWMVSLLAAGLNPSTVAWHMKAVKPFYGWAWQRRLYDADSWMRMSSVRPPRGYNGHKPRPYATKDLRRFWAELEAAFPYAKPLVVKRWHNGTSPFRSVRKHAMRLQLNAIIDLALVSGLRKVEIYNLSIDDVHWDNKYIVVHGKRVDHNPKVRDVPYADSTREAIQAWFRMRASMSPDPGLRLWLSVLGPDPARELRQQRMDNILHSFGDWTLHRLRHTCATERLRAGMELHELRDFLGHASLQQTLAYAQLMRDDIHKSAERTDADFQRALGKAA